MKKISLMSMAIGITSSFQINASFDFTEIERLLRESNHVSKQNESSVSGVLELYEQYMYNNFNIKVDSIVIEENIKKHGLFRGVIAPVVLKLDTALALEHKKLAGAYLSVIAAFDPKLGDRFSREFNLPSDLLNIVKGDRPFNFEATDIKDQFSYTNFGDVGVFDERQFNSTVVGLKGQVKNHVIGNLTTPVGPLFNNSRVKNDFSLRNVGESCNTGCDLGEGIGSAGGSIIGGVIGYVGGGGIGIIPGVLAGEEIGGILGCSAGCIVQVVGDHTGGGVPVTNEDPSSDGGDTISDDEPEIVGEAPVVDDKEPSDTDNEPETEEDLDNTDDVPDGGDESDSRVINTEVYGDGQSDFLAPQNRRPTHKVYGVPSVVTPALINFINFKG